MYPEMTDQEWEQFCLEFEEWHQKQEELHLLERGYEHKECVEQFAKEFGCSEKSLQQV